MLLFNILLEVSTGAILYDYIKNTRETTNKLIKLLIIQDKMVVNFVWKGKATRIVKTIFKKNNVRPNI